MWHTHPSISKYYLSLEDILSILKHSTNKKSIIFTEYGIWELEYREYIKFSPHHKLDEFTKDIQPILDRFYHKIKVHNNNISIVGKRIRYNHSETLQLAEDLNKSINK